MKSYNIKRGWYYIILLFLLGCHQSSKVVSTFGKRKYTGGYYFLPPKSLPASATVISKAPPQNVIKPLPGNSSTLQDISLPAISRHLLPVLKTLPQTVTSKTIDIPGNTVTTKSVNEDGVPDHNLSQNTRNHSHYGEVGFTMIILQIVLILLGGIIPGLLSATGGLILLLLVGSSILCIAGLAVKTEKYRGYAIAGLVIDILEIIGFILVIALLVSSCV